MLPMRSTIAFNDSCTPQMFRCCLQNFHYESDRHLSILKDLMKRGHRNICLNQQNVYKECSRRYINCKQFVECVGFLYLTLNLH